jgi:hypothetical protein
MTMSVSVLEKPTACRWAHEIAVMDYDTDTLYHFNFLVDDEGIEDHTISLWTSNHGESKVYEYLSENHEVPDAVMDYLMELRFNPETGELIKE